MKTSAFHALASAAALFVMCPSVMAAGQKPSIIQTRCLKCHGGGSVSGGIDFRRGLTQEQKLDALNMVASGEMPKSGPRLTPQQFAQLKIELGVTNPNASSAPKQAPPTTAARASAVKSTAAQGKPGQARVYVSLGGVAARAFESKS